MIRLLEALWTLRLVLVLLIALLALLSSCSDRTPNEPKAKTVEADSSVIVIDCWKDGTLVPCEDP